MAGTRLARLDSVRTEPATLWEVHIRVPPDGPLAIACKRGGEQITPGVIRPSSPCDALRLVDNLLARFDSGDQLFITARGHDSKLSMWSTHSRSVGLYWCAAALSQLWIRSQQLMQRRGALATEPSGTVA